VTAVVRAHVRLVVLMARPALVLLAGSYAAIGLAQHGAAGDAWRTLGVLTAVIGYLLFSVVLNDLADVAVDRINLSGDRRRPLTTGTAPRELVLVAVTGGVLAVASALVLGWWVLAVLVVGLLVAAAYSVRPLSLSKRGVVASLVLPLCVVAVPYLVGLFAADARLRAGDVALLGGLYAAIIGRLLLKDFRDVRGDSLLGKRTFLVRYGRVATCRTSAVLCLVGGVVLLLAVPDRSVALVAVYAVGLAVLVWLLARLARSTGPRQDTLLVAAVAILGRGLVMTLLAHLSMRPLAWTTLQQALVVLALGVLTLGLTSDMLRYGPRVRGRVPAAAAVQRADVV
jgi:4-hydroxybenzoate polyprenyltransferase